MKIIHIDAIKVPKERQRTEFESGALEELAHSINRIGLLHPIILSPDVELVTGERRLRAIRMLVASGVRIKHDGELLFPGYVPYQVLTESDDELIRYEAELDENIRRVDLSWKDRARAESKLHHLRGLQNAAANLPPQTLTATATEILQRTTPGSSVARGDQVTRVAERIHLAAHLSDPEVAGAKTQAEAVKIVRRKAEALQNKALAEAFEAETAKESPHRLIRGDARAELKNLPAGSVDVLLTDPPYGIDANTFGEQSALGHEYDDSEDYFHEIIQALAEESYRVCKDKAHAYVFCDPRQFTSISEDFLFSGWRVWPIPLIWAKGNGMLPRPDYAPRRTYECIMFASKGDKMVRAVKPDVISISAVRDLQHAAQKPVALYVDLLMRSVVPGDTVLDPFAGSGTIFPAATQASVRAIGIELNPAAADIATVRMNETEDPVVEFDLELDKALNSLPLS